MLAIVVVVVVRLIVFSQERYTRDPEPFDWYQRWAGLKAEMRSTSGVTN